MLANSGGYPDLSDTRSVAGCLDHIRRRLEGRRLTVMEVCGTHTWAISRFGFRDALRDQITFTSGPGCPVCVTSPADLDWAVACAASGVVLHVPGDMMRVPAGSGTLSQARAQGADVRVVYSPVGSVGAAEAESGKEHVYFAVGFETTAPAIALAVKRASDLRLGNYSIFTAVKTMPPALAILARDPEMKVDGYLLPGHVASITGSDAFTFLSDYGRPSTVAGFAPLEVAYALCVLVDLVLEGRHDAVNCYRHLVRPEGNQPALRLMDKYMEKRDAEWRGLGVVPGSGLGLRPEFAWFDAASRMEIAVSHAPEPEGCRCADVLRGRLVPTQCARFGQACTPASPLGPCMVSSEGACAAHFAYWDGRAGA